MTEPIKSKEIDAKAAKAAADKQAAEDAALLQAADKKAAEAAKGADPDDKKDEPKKGETSYAGKMVRAIHGTMIDATNAHVYTQAPSKVHEDNGWLRYQIENKKIEVVEDN